MRIPGLTLYRGAAVAVGALVVIVLVVLAPGAKRESQLRREVARAARDLEAAKPGTPGRQDIESWRRYGERLTAAYAGIAAVHREADARFERWFPGLPLTERGAPPRDAFVTRWRDEARLLENALAAASVKVGSEPDDPSPGFNWEPLRIEQLDAVGRADEPALLRDVQKRFWLRKRIADIILRSGVPVRRLVDFRFFRPLHPKIQDVAPFGGGSELVVWSGLPGAPQGRLPRDFEESPLPNGIGRTITFGVVLEVRYSDVPRAIREVLTPGLEPTVQEGMLVNVIGSQVTVRQQNAVKVTVDDPKELERSVKPGFVLLSLTCQVLDFDL
jgi:hypothetical protein